MHPTSTPADLWAGLRFMKRDKSNCTLIKYDFNILVLIVGALYPRIWHVEDMLPDVIGDATV
jgi:hypothetical protein